MDENLEQSKTQSKWSTGWAVRTCWKCAQFESQQCPIKFCCCTLNFCKKRKKRSRCFYISPEKCDTLESNAEPLSLNMIIQYTWVLSAYKVWKQRCEKSSFYPRLYCLIILHQFPTTFHPNPKYVRPKFPRGGPFDVPFREKWLRPIRHRDLSSHNTRNFENWYQESRDCHLSSIPNSW